jgi:hypothetical protein
MSDKNKDKNKDSKSAASDIDAIDKLSLSMIPLNSTTLKGARLIKNARMETAVELHNDPISGSLQIQPEDISEAFSGAESDQQVITALAALNSYDVYSMRASLKKMNIEVSDSALELSASMKLALGNYTREFTRPLVEKIFGSSHLDIEMSDGESLQKIFRDSDAARVRHNLQIITTRTGIPMEEIPAFFQSYSDVFLSVAYYRYSFESIGGNIDRFLVWIKDLQKQRDVTSSGQTVNSCRKVEENLRFLSTSMKERLNLFNAGFETFWVDINRRSFDDLRNQVEENHNSMGGVLCGLIVKMRNWAVEFPDNNAGGPQKRIKFVVSEMEPGLDKLRQLELDARKTLGLNS